MSKDNSNGFLIIAILGVGVLVTGVTAIGGAFYCFDARFESSPTGAGLCLIAAAISFVGGLIAFEKFTR
ncbi:hypothetical protein Rhal01_02232 [Rubritalea halochordaticola]|uniref:Uncharacterized protein n=1 Tax=Rubritalea halochordaticola TaxID=714537 RepID=A0ABP9V038_9BACT